MPAASSALQRSTGLDTNEFSYCFSRIERLSGGFGFKALSAGHENAGIPNGGTISRRIGRKCRYEQNRSEFTGESRGWGFVILCNGPAAGSVSQAMCAIA